MTKPTLTEAIEAKAKADAEAKAKAEAAAQETPGETQPQTANNSKADAAADEPRADGGSGTSAGKRGSDILAGERTLEDFRAAFGKEQGSVYFADGVAFADACVEHMAAQQKEIDELKAQNAELTEQNAALAKQVLGESEPVHTGGNGGRTVDAKAANRTGSEGKAAYAAHLKEKLAGKI